jgi:NDP-sugar pyrophosphorylase family protein
MVQQAMILAGGKATRMNDPTTPKALYEIGSKPVLGYVIDLLDGIERLVVAVPTHNPVWEQAIMDYVATSVQTHVTFVDSAPTINQTLQKARNYLDDTFVLACADVYTDVSVTDLVGAHRNNYLTMSCINHKGDTSEYGKVTYNDGRPRFALAGTHDGTPGLVDAAIWVADKRLIDLGTDECCWNRARTRVFTEDLATAVQTGTYWIDVGTQERYQRACAHAGEIRAKEPYPLHLSAAASKK